MFRLIINGKWRYDIWKRFPLQFTWGTFLSLFYFGSNVTILSGITIGDGAVVEACSVVTKNVPPYAIVAGNPAKLIRYRFDEKTIALLLKL